MAVFKCKMCGGTLEINNETVAICQYCGTKQTLPKLDDDRKANLYDRANHFRRNNEFDKAMGIYEQILNDDNTDAETYWSLVLCRYGIEYVEDPSSRKRIPTVNRAQFTSIFDDEDYKSALQYADGHQKDIYEQEATAINDIQKAILAISNQEEPFDVFICYKESDNSGRRTPDSVLATELYHELTREGYKVFFSRITLEDKLGTAYEPYIFAALNSAKVMVVLGTKPEFFNAVWVKNEWSRYLALIKNGARKMLIPAYKDMDPYDLPEEFSHLQAQDMSKLGFMQDLIRGIKKIVETDSSKPTISTTIITNENAVGNITALLKRGFMALEDGAWNKADDFFEQCLNQDAELAEAYLGKLMAELCVKNQDDLSDCAEPFDNCDNYRKTIRFADKRLKIKMEDFITRINERNESNRLAEQYASCVRAMDLAKSEDDYISVAKRLDELGDYKDSVNLSRKSLEIAETVRKDAILADAKTWMTNAITSREKAIRMLKSIPGWKNSDELCLDCEKKIEELKAKAEADRLERERKAEIDRIEAEKRKKRSKKIAIIVTSIVVAVIIFIIILNSVIIPNSKYNDAVALMNNSKYDDALSIFMQLDGYKDSKNMIENCNEKKYEKALALINDGKYFDANNILLSLNEYKDSLEIQKTIKNNVLIETLKLSKTGGTVKFGLYEQDNDANNGKEEIEWVVLSKEDEKVLLISKYILDNRKFNSSYDNHTNTWSKSAIRSWLNNEFKNNAFNYSETTVMCDTTIDESSTTRDKVFLLSINEANKYFKSDEERKCENTEYSKYHSMSNEGNWWLRTKNGRKYGTIESSNVAVVNFYGKIDGEDTGGLGEESTFYCGVRPAIWIDLSQINNLTK